MTMAVKRKLPSLDGIGEREPHPSMGRAPEIAKNVDRFKSEADEILSRNMASLENIYLVAQTIYKSKGNAVFEMDEDGYNVYGTASKQQITRHIEKVDRMIPPMIDALKPILKTVKYDEWRNELVINVDELDKKQYKIEREDAYVTRIKHKPSNTYITISKADRRDVVVNADKSTGNTTVSLTLEIR